MQAKGAKFVTNNLQFPTGHSTKSPGIGDALKFLVVPSVVLKNAYQSELTKRATYDPSKLEDMLKCYRYFKEIRNCLAHYGGIANKTAEEAYKKIAVLDLPKALGLKVPPNILPTVEGQPVRLNPHGANAFAFIVLKLIQTIDGLLSETELARNELELRLQPTKSMKLLPGEPTKRKGRVLAHFSRARAFRPAYSVAIDKWLSAIQITRA